MLKGLQRAQGSVGLLALLALAAFLMCTLLPHHSHGQDATSGSAHSASATASHASGVSHHGAVGEPSHAPGADAVASSPGDGHEPHQEPTCHNPADQFMDVAGRFMPATPDELLGLLGAVLVAAGGVVRPAAWPRVPLWLTRPPRLLSGFPLLIALGVSRT